MRAAPRRSAPGLASQVASPLLLLSRHGPRSPLAPWLLVKVGKGGKGVSPSPLTSGKPPLACRALQPAGLSLYRVCSPLSDAHFPQILLTGLFCEGEGAVLPLYRNARNPPPPPTPWLRIPHTGAGVRRDELAKQRHFQPKEEANALCPRGQRCPRAFFFRPSQHHGAVSGRK